MSNISVRKKIAALDQRAKQRRVAFSAMKCDEDVTVENCSFEELKPEIYKSIVRSDCQ